MMASPVMENYARDLPIFEWTDLQLNKKVDYFVHSDGDHAGVSTVDVGACGVDWR